MPMAVSMEQVQQWVKEWVVGFDPEVDVQVLSPHDDPREMGEIIPVRLGRRAYRLTVGFPESSFSGSPLPEGTDRHRSARKTPCGLGSKPERAQTPRDFATHWKEGGHRRRGAGRTHSCR